MRLLSILTTTIFASLPLFAQAEPYVGELSPASIKLSNVEMTFATNDGLKGFLSCATEWHLNGRRGKLQVKIENAHEMSLEYDAQWLQVELESGALHQYDFSSDPFLCEGVLSELKLTIDRAGRARMVASKAERWLTPDGPRKLFISTRVKPEYK